MLQCVAVWYFNEINECTHGSCDNSYSFLWIVIGRCTTHCNTLQHTAKHCNTLQHTAKHCNTLQDTATRCSTLCCSVLQCAAVCCSVLQCATAYCSVVQCVAVRFVNCHHMIRLFQSRKSLLKMTIRNATKMTIRNTWELPFANDHQSTHTFKSL